MRYTLRQLDKKSESRPQGYREDVLAVSKDLGNENYEITDEAYQALAEKYRLPSVRQLIANVAEAVRQAVKDGFDVRAVEEAEKYMSICVTCPFFIERDCRCGKCGCWLTGKMQLKAWHCPLKKW